MYCDQCAGAKVGSISPRVVSSKGGQEVTMDIMDLPLPPAGDGKYTFAEKGGVNFTVTHVAGQYSVIYLTDAQATHAGSITKFKLTLPAFAGIGRIPLSIVGIPCTQNLDISLVSVEERPPAVLLVAPYLVYNDRATGVRIMTQGLHTQALLTGQATMTPLVTVDNAPRVVLCERRSNQAGEMGKLVVLRNDLCSASEALCAECSKIDGEGLVFMLYVHKNSGDHAGTVTSATTASVFAHFKVHSKEILPAIGTIYPGHAKVGSKVELVVMHLPSNIDEGAWETANITFGGVEVVTTNNQGIWRLGHLLWRTGHAKFDIPALPGVHENALVPINVRFMGYGLSKNYSYVAPLVPRVKRVSAVERGPIVSQLPDLAYEAIVVSVQSVPEHVLGHAVSYTISHKDFSA
jgi:hypothetical protein